MIVVTIGLFIGVVGRGLTRRARSALFVAADLRGRRRFGTGSHDRRDGRP
jgi:hypothetical protein